MHQHMKLTMNWHIKSWVERVNKLNVIIIVTVARQVKWSDTSKMSFTILDNIRAFTHQTVNCPNYILFISRYGIRTEYHGISIFNFYMSMSTTSHTIKHCIKLTLRTSTNNSYLTIRQFNYIFHFNNSIFRNFNSTRTQSNFEIL